MRIRTKGKMLGYQYPPLADQLFSIHDSMFTSHTHTHTQYYINTFEYEYLSHVCVNSHEAKTTAYVWICLIDVNYWKYVSE